MIEKLLTLLQLPQLGAQRIARLLDSVDFEQLCRYDKAQLRQIGWNEKQIQRWFHPDTARIEEAMRWAEQPDCHILSLFDEAYPFLLRQIATAPPILFVKGAVSILSQAQIAMVGSRDYSHYGEHWAGQFATDLVKQGLVITSGLAIGIDGFCHQRAIAEGGQTVAVLGSGLNQVYPSRHKSLAEKIIESGGALVSEFFPNQPPLAENFPRRNRIISGLSLGTFVIEAAVNSGSLITARYAMEQGREVFALPNTAQNPYASGCHKLIKEGALLVDSVQDIIEAVAWQQQQQPIQPPLFEPPSNTKPSVQPIGKTPFAENHATLTACQQQIVKEIHFEPITIDDLAKACDLNIETLLIELLNLELIGIVKAVDGGYVRT